MDEQGSYAFGDGDLAARRLELVAQVFAPSTSAFLADVSCRADLSSKGKVSAVDLGCGPGFTTALLCDALPTAEVIGLDTSEDFLERARLRAARARFRRHDVREIPFPVAPADVLYCRFLLSHLAEPGEVVRRWERQVQSGGRLLIEEVEDIQTEAQVFRTYLALTESVVRQHAGRLYVGGSLDRAAFGESWAKKVSRVAELAVSDARAAAMFSLNLKSLKARGLVPAISQGVGLEELEQQLENLATAGRGHRIEWRLRQMALIRR